MPPLVIILHAPEEEVIAERLVEPIRGWGYDVWHTGNVLVGDVVVKELSDRLADNGPVVINGTTRAAGSKWLKTVLGHLQDHHYNKRVFPVRIEADANLEGVCLGAKIAECAPNFPEGLKLLKEALYRSFPISLVEQSQAIIDGTQNDFDSWLTNWTSFSEDLLVAYRKMLRPEIRESRLSDELDPLTFLTRANLLANSRLYAAGVLLFTDSPEKLIPSAFVQCVLYRGLSKDSGQSHSDLYGSVSSQIDRAMLFVANRTDKIEVTKPGEVAAKTIYRFPMVCLREVIANAVCHRDYMLRDRHVHVRIFSDRIEILSPGEWLTKGELHTTECSLEELESESVTRNERLASALRWIKLVETEGSGIPNALADCRETGSPYPVVVTKDGFVRVTLFPRKSWDTEVISRRGHMSPGSTVPLAELPLPKRDDDFEDLVVALFRVVWQDPGAKLHGRSGQPQDGVDLFGEDRFGGSGLNGVQCKHHGSATPLKDKDLVAELREEVEKAKGFRPPLQRFIFATTARRSATLQQEARDLTELHRKDGLFAVDVLAWEDIEDLLRRHSDVLAWYLDERTKVHGPHLDLGRLPIPGPNFVGREAELARLDAAWEDPTIHVLTLVAFGGVGKSALVARWLDHMATEDWRGAARVLDWSFYSQGMEDRVTSAEPFIDYALHFFDDPDPKAGSLHDRGARLAGLIRKERSLLVLDGIEPLQYPPGPTEGRLKDPGLTALLKGLAGANPGLCVVTTRERIADLAGFQKTAPQIPLEELEPDAAVALLRQLGVVGRESELRAAAEEFQRHALTLTLLGNFLRRAHGGDVRKRREIDLHRADERQGGHAFRLIEAEARWLGEGPERSILRLIGLFDRPADAGALKALRAAPPIPGLTEPLVDLSDEDWNLATATLRDHGLVATADPQELGTLDAHPLLRAFFAEELQNAHPDAWQEGNLRLYEHFRQAAPDLPETLEALQPLYTAVVHGCRAGRQQEAMDEVYWRRILRGNEQFSLRKLGAFGADLTALAGFFDRPWYRPSVRLTSPAQAFVLNTAAFCLRALGRLTEAVEPMQASLEARIAQENWENAAATASNLSELTLNLGDVPRAVAFGEQSVDLADRSGAAFERMNDRATWADALHHAGRWEESEAAFRETEAMQAEAQPEYPRLYSLWGFRYCDLFLSRAEPEAGSGLDGLTGSGSGPEETERFRRTCREVIERARLSLEWAEEAGLSLLTIALNHLTLGRAYFGLALTASGEDRSAGLAQAVEQLDRAVDGLRRAGQEQELPRGFLARTALRRFRSDFAGATADLTEALEIAERGPMRLHECDAHLEWARLCRDQGDLAAARRHVARARELVNETGYGRREREVAWLEKTLAS